MLVLVIVLVVTNLAALGALAYLYLVPAAEQGPDATAAAALDRTPPPPVVGGTRRLISIEILNPIELAGTRGRIVGLAGSLAPGLTRRIVYDQTLKILRRQLVEQQVVADVRLHTLRPVPPERPAAPPARPNPPPAKPGTIRTVPPGPSRTEPYTDEIEAVDLARLDDGAQPDDRPGTS